MPATPKFGLRFPASTDSPDVPRDIGNLANDVETALGPGTAPPSGIVTGEAEVWNGTTWARSSITRLGIGSLAGYPADATKVLYGDGTWRALPAAPTIPVASVFGRTGAVTAQPGDYTAAQVTGAADKTASATQTFSGALSTGLPALSPATGAAGSFIATGAAGGIATGSTAPATNVALVCGNSGAPAWMFQLRQDGQMTWGDGNPRDTNLYRSAANVLQTDDTFVASTGLATAGTVSTGPTSATFIGQPTNGGIIDSSGRFASFCTAAVTAFAAGAISDTAPRWQVDSNGITSWGVGTAAADTSLQRGAPGLLRISGSGGVGNYQGGTLNSAPGLPATITPNAACVWNRIAPINVSGTLTIPTPLGQPTSGQSGFFFLNLANTMSSGTPSVAWGAAWHNPPAFPAPLTSDIYLCVWNPSLSKWEMCWLASQ